MPEQRDIVVVGAGPSGSIASALLKRRGWDVLVLEAQQFPRFSVGESLLAHCLDFVAEAGMLDGVVTSDTDLVAELLGQALARHDAVDPDDAPSANGEDGGRSDVIGPQRPLEHALLTVLPMLEGAFSLVVMDEECIVGVRDPQGFRPLCLGRLDDSWVLASETPALDIVGATFVRELAAGEMVVITREGIESIRPFPPKPRRFCIFEYVYFARPDSLVEGRNVYDVRKRIGAELAHESPAEADMVIPVPDSGVPAALGFSEASGLPFELGIIRNHYVGRTFIEPSDRIRHLGVKLKHNANRAKLQGSEIADHELGRVRHENADAVPFFHADRCQPGRQPVCRIVDLAISHPGALENGAGLFRMFGGDLFQKME